MAEDPSVQHIISFKDPINVSIHAEQKEKPRTSIWASPFWDLLKWFLGSIVLGVAAMIINSAHQETELELKRMETDSKLIDAISAKFDTSAVVQGKYLRFIGPFISTPSLKKAIEERISLLEPYISSENKDSTKNSINKFSSKIENNTSPEEKEKLISLGQQRPAQQQSIDTLKQKENGIVSNKNITPIDSVAIKKIEETKSILTKPILEEYSLLSAPQTKWCKENYYVEYNNTIRIGINDLNADAKKVVVNLKDIEGGQETPILVNNQPNVSISAGNPLEVKYHDYKYFISLDYIGSAGKNPFTKAAYISVTVYKKNNSR